MDIDSATTGKIPDEHSVADASKRERSKIVFVYNDLEDAAKLAGTLQSRAATAACEVKQLASWMNQSSEGGTFRSVLGAARTFGLIETQRGGSVALTMLGRDALDDNKRQNALAEAFLQVALHKKLYEQYEGYALPPPAAIERQIESLGVPKKQKERARQTFTKSAHYAGYIDPQTGRVIKPPTAVAPPPSAEPPEKNKNSGGGGGDGDGLNLDALLMALLKKIPPSGDSWPKEQRVRWFRTFAMNVSQIYDTPEDAVDLKIDIDPAKKDTA
jgi:hypothetical protein